MSIPPHLQQFLQTGVLQTGYHGDQQHATQSQYRKTPQSESNGRSSKDRSGGSGSGSRSTNKPPAFQQDAIGSGSVPPHLQQLFSSQSAQQDNQLPSAEQSRSMKAHDPDQAKKNAAANLPILQAFLESSNGGIMHIQQPQQPPQMVWNPYYGWVPNHCQPQAPIMSMPLSLPTAGFPQIVDDTRSQTPTPQGMPKNRISAVHIKKNSSGKSRTVNDSMTSTPRNGFERHNQDSSTIASDMADLSIRAEERDAHDTTSADYHSDAYSDAPLSRSLHPSPINEPYTLSPVSGREQSRSIMPVNGKQSYIPFSPRESDPRDSPVSASSPFHEISESNPFNDTKSPNPQGRISSFGALSPVPFSPGIRSMAVESPRGLGLTREIADQNRDSIASTTLTIPRDYHASPALASPSTSSLARRAVDNRTSALSQVPNTAYSRSIAASTRSPRIPITTRSSLNPTSKEPGLTLPLSPRPGPGLPLSPRPQQNQTPSNNVNTNQYMASSSSDRAKSYIRTRTPTRPENLNTTAPPRMPSLLRPGYASGIKRYSEIPDDGVPLSPSETSRPSIPPYPRTGNSTRKRSSTMGRGESRAYPSSDEDDILDGYLN